MRALASARELEVFLSLGGSYMHHLACAPRSKENRDEMGRIVQSKVPPENAQQLVEVRKHP